MRQAVHQEKGVAACGLRGGSGRSVASKQRATRFDRDKKLLHNLVSLLMTQRRQDGAAIGKEMKQ